MKVSFISRILAWFRPRNGTPYRGVTVKYRNVPSDFPGVRECIDALYSHGILLFPLTVEFHPKGTRLAASPNVIATTVEADGGYTLYVTQTGPDATRTAFIHEAVEHAFAHFCGYGWNHDHSAHFTVLTTDVTRAARSLLPHGFT